MFTCIRFQHLQHYVPAFKGDDILVLLGDDFNYMGALQYFKNSDKLIHYINLLNGTNLNAFYSTPSAYLKTKLDSGIEFPVKTDDLFPYADNPHSYWTGYFTSRPALKRYIRESTNVQQTARQLQLLAGGAADLGPNNPLYLLERAVGVAQHHDAVSGTAKQHVTWDYQKRLSIGRAAAAESVSASLTTLTGYSAATFTQCDLSNVTICPALEGGQQQVLALYNGQAQAWSNAPVRIPIGLPMVRAGTHAHECTHSAPAPSSTVPWSGVGARSRIH